MALRATDAVEKTLTTSSSQRELLSGLKRVDFKVTTKVKMSQ